MPEAAIREVLSVDSSAEKVRGSCFIACSITRESCIGKFSLFFPPKKSAASVEGDLPRLGGEAHGALLMSDPETAIPF